MGYIKGTQPLNEAFLFNDATRTSYHPWSGITMGEAFGDSGLKELIGIKDYLELPPAIDEFLEGVTVGMRKAEKRKQEMAKKIAAENKGKNSGAAMVDEMLKKGVDNG